MTYLFSIIYLIILMFSITFIFKKYKTIFCPLTLVVINYCLFPFITTFHPLGLYDFAFETHFLIILSYFIFFFGYVYFTQNMKPMTSEEKKPASVLRYKLLIVVNLIIFVFLFPRLIVAWEKIQSNGWSYLRTFANETYSESTIDNIIYSWFIKSFVIASVAVLSYDLLNNRNKLQIPATIIVVMNVLLDVVIFAARATLVKLIIYLFFAFFFCKIRKYTKKQKISVAFLVVLLMISLVYVSNERMSTDYSSFNFVDTIVMYYCAPFGLFNYYIVNPSYSMLGINHLLFGGATFGFVYNIFRSGLYVVFDLPYNGSEFIINQVTANQVRVGTSVAMNAGSTATYIFMRDFGFLGILFGFVLLSWLISFAQKKYLQNPSTRTGSIYIVLLYVIFRLSSTYDMISASFTFIILFIILLTKRSKSNVRRF